MNRSYPGRYLPEPFAQWREVKVTLAPHGVAIEGGDPDPVWWPFASLRAAPSAQGIRFESKGATLQMEDSAFLAELRRINARVARGDTRESGSRVVFALCAIAAAMLLSLAAALYWGLPAVASGLAALLPAAVEAKLGDAALEALAPAAKRCMDPSLERIVDRLRTAAAGSGYTFRVYVAEDPMINAFATPGGNIVMFRGLLDKTRHPEEAAAVLAHEMQHVIRRHAIKEMMRGASLWAALALITGGSGDAAVQMAGVLGSLHYQRGDEEDADQEGIQMLHRAGVNPTAMVSMLELLERVRGEEPEAGKYLSSHPLTRDRIDVMRRLAREFQRTAASPFPAQTWPPSANECR